MNTSILKTITRSFFVLLWTMLSAWGQSGLPGGVTPVVHLKAEDGATLVVDYASYYYNYHWNWVDAANSSLVFVHSTSSYDDPASSSNNVNRIDEDGYQAIQVKYSAGFRIDPDYTGTSIGANLGGDFDTFIVKGSGNLRFRASGSNSAEFFWTMNQTSSTCETGDRDARAWASASLASNQNRRQLMGMSVENGIISIMHNGKVLNRSSYASSNSMQVLYAIDFYANSYDAAVNTYEILVFKKLNATDYAKVQQYLLGKYNIEPDIPKTSLTLWVKADAGITADANGEISRIKDHSGYNHDLYTKYGSIKLNASAANGMPAFSWGTSYSNSTGNMIYNFNSNPDLVNGKAGEFFIVMNPKSNYYPTNYISRFSESGNQLIAKTALGSSYIYEGFGRNINDIAYATLPFPMYNNWTVYNVSVGGGIWESYLNSTLLRKDTNYQLSSNMAFYSFCIGFDMTSGGIYDVSSYRNPFEGSLAEVLVYNRKLTETERVQVRNYLMAKYGLQ